MSLPSAKKLLMGASVRPGQTSFTTPGVFKWKCPPGVRKVSAVAVGAGSGIAGGAGGSLAWKNNIPVTPGQEYDVRVGASASIGDTASNSFFISTSTVFARGGAIGSGPAFVGDGGGAGGLGAGSGYGGGGAGGYGGQGGQGGTSDQIGPGQAGQGGGGAGGADRQGGGGVGILGIGANGSSPGQGGSGGEAGTSSNGGRYGGGASGNTASYQGGVGAVRIIWGAGRAFPATKTGNL